jgi:hypothetical protein
MSARLLCMLLAPAAIAAAQSSQAEGKKIVDEALEALGGRSFLAMQDRVEVGRVYSFYREQLSGLSRAAIFTRYLTRPEPPQPGFIGIRERQAYGKKTPEWRPQDTKEDSSVLFTEREGYELTFRGARPIAGDIYDRYRETTLRNIFYILRQRLGEPGLIFEARGTEVIENEQVRVVDIIDSENRLVTVHFHHITKLPVRQITVRRDARNERFEETTRYSKFRDVGGGVMWPFTIQRERDGEKLFEIYSEKVTVNQNLTDDLFTLPGNMKVLTKKK